MPEVCIHILFVRIVDWDCSRFRLEVHHDPLDVATSQTNYSKCMKFLLAAILDLCVKRCHNVKLVSESESSRIYYYKISFNNNIFFLLATSSGLDSHYIIKCN